MKSSLRIIYFLIVSAILNLVLYPVNPDSLNTYVISGFATLCYLCILAFYPLYKNKVIFVFVALISLLGNPFTIYILKGQFPSFITMIFGYILFSLALLASETEKNNS